MIYFLNIHTTPHTTHHTPHASRTSKHLLPSLTNMSEHITAFCSQEQVNRNTIIRFYTSRSFCLPDELRTCSIEQFQTVLLFAAKLLQLEKTISEEFTRDSLFAEYLKDINQKHSEQLATAEKKSALEISSKLSPLVSKISEIPSLEGTSTIWKKTLKEPQYLGTRQAQICTVMAGVNRCLCLWRILRK